MGIDARLISYSFEDSLFNFEKVSSKPGLDEDFVHSQLSVQTLHSHSKHRLLSARDLVNLV